MAMPTDVDRSAPVLANHEVEIRAPLDTVWQLHIDVNDWPRWQEAITEQASRYIYRVDMVSVGDGDGG